MKTSNITCPLVGFAKSLSARSVLVVLFASMGIASPCVAQWEGREELYQDVEKAFGSPPGMVRLSKSERVWADPKKKRVVADGYVCLKNGQLEMFACLIGTKEHESVVSIFAKAQTVHAGLLAVGAKKGTPVKWEPQYTAPTGSEIRIVVLWTDADGKRRTEDAKRWIRKLGTDDHLDMNFVFAGSSMWKDPESGKEKYLAESGDLVCVSNFSTATLDLPMKSSQVNEGLMFAAYTKRIPEVKTPVRLVFQVITENDEENPQPATTKEKTPAKPKQLKEEDPAKVQSLPK